MQPDHIAVLALGAIFLSGWAFGLAFGCLCTARAVRHATSSVRIKINGNGVRVQDGDSLEVKNV